MDEQELFALVRKNYGEANTEYLKQQVIAAVSQMTLPSKKETIDGLLDWIVLAGGCGMNEKYRQFVYSALSLLKEQEPRVMTEGEVLHSIGKPLWFESRGVYLGQKGFWCLLFEVDQELHIRIVQSVTGGKITLSLIDYGKTWRCWISRPTDEQRKEVPWG